MEKAVKTPVCTFLVGCPGAGKSSWRKSIVHVPENVPVVISTDDYIEAKSIQNGISYREGFKRFYEEAEQYMWKTFLVSIKNNNNIVIDRTNVTGKSRRKFLSKLPKNYFKKAVVFQRPLEYLLEVNETRVSLKRDIPINAIEHLYKIFSVPNTEEGFDKIVFKDCVRSC